MPASKVSSESNSSTVYVLVVFIVLFLAAATFAVVMFLGNEELRKNAETAQTELEKFGTSNELREVRPLVQKNKTVLAQLSADMKQLCSWIGGDDLAELSLVGAKVTTEKRLKETWEQLAMVLTNPEEGDPSVGLANIVDAMIKENRTLGQQFAQVEKEKMEQVRRQEQVLKGKDDEIAQLKGDLATASSAAQTSEQSYSRRVKDLGDRFEELIKRINDEKAQLQSENDKLTKQMEELQKEIAKYDEKIKEMEVVLQQIRPSPDMELAALDADGTVVSVNSRDMLAYISLAKNDHIYRGLTFTVYDSYTSIPKTGKGKGKLEVVEILDTISKCRITEYDSTYPIMEKDIIANLIWDKDKKYQFCVAGDFDFDQNGEIDPDGREQIVSLINNWGGQAVSSLSVDTDFLVLGQPSAVPMRPREEDFDRNTEVVKKYNQAVQNAEKYKAILQSGKSLGVPTFNTSRFFRFIGYHPRGVIERKKRI
ncbi:MAG: hypothetical protein KAT56_02455 [Sedimentisphaerales bacterium]|nr:hypothetical protein [Sedimentisphaerales bacterium]